jgi:hypothetical protein
VLVRADPISSAPLQSSWPRTVLLGPQPAQKETDLVDTDSENGGGESGGDGSDGGEEYISGIDSLNAAGEAVEMSATPGIYVLIAEMSADNNWDQATEAKVRRLSDTLKRLPTAEEITKAIEE